MYISDATQLWIDLCKFVYCLYVDITYSDTQF